MSACCEIKSWHIAYDTCKQSNRPYINKIKKDTKFIWPWKHRAIFEDEVIAVTLPMMFMNEIVMKQHNNESVMTKTANFHTFKWAYYWRPLKSHRTMKLWLYLCILPCSQQMRVALQMSHLGVRTAMLNWKSHVRLKKKKSFHSLCSSLEQQKFPTSPYCHRWLCTIIKVPWNTWC